ncbi:ABC transporter substrate-binding protein [Vibrio mediterranei]|uniref:ABC transporter substrate-binding protein n=1 Tax=Vibrio mediterranei TaxID=689 RepID=UPI0022843DFA|nr:ABC transporter substrate-binding protein [Vibrio mediterranei]MCY9851856.1 ABC transporter substrate-binding protein [Vibrio mediterranei]
MNMRKSLLALLLTSTIFPTFLQASEVEVLHWWTSGGEAKSVQILKQKLEQRGYTWKDFAIAGGGGESAMTVLKTRAVSGNPPSAAQIKGEDIQEWGGLGFLTNLDDVAKADGWDEVLPPVVAAGMKYDGKYVAVPVNIHRVNWLWVNPQVLEKSGVDSVPETLEQFFAAAEKIKAAGFTPLANGSGPWQDTTLFETIALAVLGPEDFRQAFVNLDMDTLSSDKMAKVFETFGRMREYMDEDVQGREWNVATNRVLNGQAAMQIMGDWAKGEFTAAGKIPGKDYLCVPAPGTKGQFIQNVDSFAFFDIKDEAEVNAQKALARTIMDKQFQEVFNLNKGSFPVRTDMDMHGFDKCALDSRKTFEQSIENDGLVPSMSQNMATTSYVLGAITDVVSNFFNDPEADPKKAAHKLAKAVKAAI